MFSRTLLAAAAAALTTGGVHAEELKPIHAKNIDLGTLAGVIYYTVEAQGYRVVATLGTDMPVRFVATLGRDQSITLSTPRGIGEPPIEVRVTRHGEQLLVDGGAKLGE